MTALRILGALGLAAVASLSVLATTDGTFARLEVGPAEPRSYAAPRDTDLGSVARTQYTSVASAALLWPPIYEANRAVLAPGSIRVKAGTSLAIPSLPADAARRATYLAGSFDSVWKRFLAHLDAGDLQSAGHDRFLLLQGWIPLLAKGLAGPEQTKQAKSITARIARLWSAHQAIHAATAAGSAPAEASPDKYVTAALAASHDLDRASKSIAGTEDAALQQRIDAAHASLQDGARQAFRQQARAIGDRYAEPADPAKGPARAREARLALFQWSYHACRLSAAPALRHISEEAQQDLAVARLAVPPPPPDLPAITERALGKDKTGKRSMTVAHAPFAQHWFPMAATYARGLWKSFPSARNAWGREITREDVLKAVIMHESRGIHMENGSITANRNSTASVDLGFAQINNVAHPAMKVRLSEMAALMGGDWTVAKLASRDYLDLPKGAASGPVLLDFNKPAHNLIAAVEVLSHSFERNYPATSSEEERLVKSLSGYNHGARSRDYNIPWLDFVKSVPPQTGSQGQVSAVNYGIGMKLYLGMNLHSIETDWWTRRQRISLVRMFHLNVDAYYSYAHFE